MMNSYRLVLADDHIILRDGIKHMVHEKPDLEVVGEASNGLELLRLLNRKEADMILLDISMPGMRGLEAAQKIRGSHPEIKILILTMHKKRSYIRNALAAGVDGYLLKEAATGDELFEAITSVRKGGRYISKSLSGELTSEMITFYQGGREHSKEVLTTREKEVLKLVAEGRESKEIADLLCISIYTVNNHRANIIRKLGMRKTADLVKYAIQEGYISQEEYTSDDEL
ncbi:MAG: response regulator [Syntrophorhabdus sp.]